MENGIALSVNQAKKECREEPGKGHCNLWGSFELRQSKRLDGVQRLIFRNVNGQRCQYTRIGKPAVVEICACSLSLEIIYTM